jgi:AbiU2
VCEFEDVLGALAKETVMGRSHLWSWWCLSLTLSRKPDLLQKAPIFLGLTLKAHVNEAWLVLVRLYDKDRRTATIHYAVRLAEENAGQFRSASAEGVRKLLAKVETEVAGIAGELEGNGEGLKTYRDEVIAHLNVTRLREGGGLSVLNRMVNPPRLCSTRWTSFTPELNG